LRVAPAPAPAPSPIRYLPVQAPSPIIYSSSRLNVFSIDDPVIIKIKENLDYIEYFTKEKLKPSMVNPRPLLFQADLEIILSYFVEIFDLRDSINISVNLRRYINRAFLKTIGFFDVYNTDILSIIHYFLNSNQIEKSIHFIYQEIINIIYYFKLSKFKNNNVEKSNNELRLERHVINIREQRRKYFGDNDLKGAITRYRQEMNDELELEGVDRGEEWMRIHFDINGRPLRN
jgi:hypothetical protein